MSPSPSRLPGRGSFDRGIHTEGHKGLAADSPIEVLPAPLEVAVPLLQHTGSACEATVKPRDAVTLGQLIGRAVGMISASVHASVTGTIGMPSVATLSNGRHVKTVTIKSAGPQLEGRALWDDTFGGDWPLEGLDAYTPEQIAGVVADAGIVGMGGAAFPTHVKFARNVARGVARTGASAEGVPPSSYSVSSSSSSSFTSSSKQQYKQQDGPVRAPALAGGTPTALTARTDAARAIDTLLVNGCECEPYLTADYRLMIEAPRAIVCGAILAGRAAGAARVVVAIEDNKPLAIESMRVAAGITGVIVRAVKTKYPMGGERQVIPAVLARTVPTGGLPLDVGVVVVNVATTAAIARAVVRGKPLTHRVVTVSGRGIARAANLLVPIGVSYQAMVDYCGGLAADAARAIAGGPMMGFAVGDLGSPVTKGTSGLTILTAADVRAEQSTACIRCGRCVDVCPLHLVPTKIALAADRGDWELARRYHMTACCECGCCSFICPARIPLVQLIRVGKAQMFKEPAKA